jgi:hypothetical protein
MRLLADEDFPLPSVLRLRELGHDVVTALEAGVANEETPDARLLELATNLQRALLTHNRRHFRRLHAAHPQHAGMILCTRDPNFAQLAQRVHDACGAASSLDGQLIRVVRPNVSA